MKKFFLLFFCGALLSGCASAPPFDCDSARERVKNEQANARQFANDYHAAQGQKDGAYYGVKAARATACIGSLGLLCGVADGIASDNTEIERAAETAEENYKQSARVAAGLREVMQDNECANVPPPLDGLK